MAAIEAVMTDVGLAQLAKHLAGDVSSVQLNFFRIGEGGYTESGLVKSPKIPDPTRTRLESEGTPLTGTLSFINSVTAVTGVGTAFLSEVTAGQYIRLDDDLVWAQVLSVTNDNNLVLSLGYTGSTGSGAGSKSALVLFTFEKAYVGTDLTFEEAGRMSAVAFLDFLDGNDDGFGGSPEFFEIGVFDAAGNMIAYGTYPGEVKTIGIQFNKIVRITMTRE